MQFCSFVSLSRLLEIVCEPASVEDEVGDEQIDCMESTKNLSNSYGTRNDANQELDTGVATGGERI